jgi:hypothetical protein
VSDAKWFDGWLPAGLAAAGRALLPSVPTTPAAVLRSLSEQLVGRRLTARAGDADIELTVVELDYQTDTLRLAAGKLGDVRIVAEDITWPETPVKRVTAVARDVRLRSLPTPAAIPASVEIEIVVSGDVVRTLIGSLRPGIVAEPGGDGMIAIRSARHPRWGYAELEPCVEDAAVSLHPRALRIGRFRLPLPQRLKPIMLPPPGLPPGLRLTEIEARDDEVVLRTLAEEWPERLSRIPLPDLLSRLTTAALTMTIPRLSPRRRLQEREDREDR